MTDEALAALRATLRTRRAELLQEKPAKIEPGRQDETAVGVPDEDAQALSEMNQVLASTKNRERALRIAAIDRALVRLAEAPEEAGLCQDCGEPIAAKRLALVPWVEYCADCQAAHDPKRGERRRGLLSFK